MIYHYKKGTPSIVGGAGDGTKADPWYWYRISEGQTVDVDSSNADSNDNYRLYFRVKLKSGTPYQIGQSRPGGGDGRIKLYNDGWTEVQDNDDASTTIAGVSCSDHFTYTPTTDGVFYIGAGAYSTAHGAFSVAINPAPEQEPLPEIQLVYPTSSGFNKAGKAVGYRSASSAECNIIRIPKDGLVFYASLSSNMTTAESGQALTTVGNVTYDIVDGLRCADFARSAYLYTEDISNFPVGSSDRTLSCYVKIDSDSSGRHGVLSYGNGGGSGTLFGMEVRSKKLAICGANSSSNEASSTSTFDITTWNHVAIKYQSGVVKFYINGVLDGNFTYNYNTQLSRLWIGILDGSNCYEPKKIAACRIYDRALTDDEIKQLAGEFDV